MKANILKKTGSALLAAAIAANCAFVGNIFTTTAADLKYEFEDAEYTSDILVEGDGLYMQDSGTITLTVNIETAGTYDLTFYAFGVGGDKQQNVSVNGVSQGAIDIPKGTDYAPCTMSNISLKAGENTITIEKSWGWSQFDYMIVSQTVLPEILATDTICCDPNVIPQAQSLMNYMASVYGSNIISGQQEIYSNGPHGLEYEFEYLENLTGHLPAIRGFDYGNFSCPCYGSDDGSTDRIIDWVQNKGGIATSSWHLNVPTDFASYTIGSKIDWSATTYSQNTDFSPEAAATEGTKENEYYLQALTILAKEFNELEALGIPVIWRPLHEAEGGGGETGSWFWWGREGSAAYKKLWIYTYETLTHDFDCHNLIWEWNSYNFASSANWYPGDEYVDIIGYDKYSCTDWSTGSAVIKHNDSSFASTFYGIMEKYNSTKMVSMAENDSFSTVDNLIADKAGWLYFCTWYDGGSSDINFVSDPRFNTEQDTIDMYQSDYCITLDELPADLYTQEIIPVVTTTADPNVTTTTTTTTTADPAQTTTTAYVFEQFGESFDISERPGTESDELVFEIEGTPNASVGGGVGFGTSAADWVNLEWSCNLDENGKYIVSIPMSEIPSNITSVEVQVWWSNLWDSATETSSDVPCEINYIDMVTDGVAIPGDTDGNGVVELNDAVMIMSSIADPDNYALTADQIARGDVYQHGDGISNMDALSIQKYLAQLISELPESEMTDSAE